ncbi:hypothetical protein Aperf_G00000092851 [Anoplocephala perfoliata]
MMICGCNKGAESESIVNSVRENGEIPMDVLEGLKTRNDQIGKAGYAAVATLAFDVRVLSYTARDEREIPLDKGLAAVLHYLSDQIEHENCVEGVLAWIAQSHCRSGASTHPLLPLHIWKVFLIHDENPAIFEHGLEILIHCTSIGEMRLQAAAPITSENDGTASWEFFNTLRYNSTCWNETSLALISKLAKRHSEHLRVHEKVFVLLEAIFCPLNVNDLTQEAQLSYWSKYGPIYRSLCNMDYPDLIIKALMRVHDGYAGILRIALAVMWKLCIDQNNAKKFIDLGAFKLVYDTMYYWPKHPGIINQGALCLAALSSTRLLKEEALMQVDIITLFLDSVYTFCHYTDICYNLFYAIGAIINQSAEQVLRFVRPNIKDKERGIVALIFKANMVHHDNDRILGILLSLLEVIMANDGTLEAIVDDIPALRRLLTKIKYRFSNPGELGMVAQRILNRIPDAYNLGMSEEEKAMLNQSTLP